MVKEIEFPLRLSTEDFCGQVSECDWEFMVRLAKDHFEERREISYK